MLVREVETANSARFARNFLLWRLGVAAFITLVALASLRQDGTSASGPPPPRDDAPELTAEEIDLQACLPSQALAAPVEVRATRASLRTRSSGPIVRPFSRECLSCHKDPH